MKARRAVVVVSAAQHSRVHRCWHLLIQTLHCGWRVLHCGRRVLHCGRRRSIEIGMLVHKDLHCWSVLRIFTNQGKVSSNIFVNIKIFLRNLRKYLIIYPLDKNPWFGPLWLYWLYEMGFGFIWDWAAAFRLRGAVCIDCHLFPVSMSHCKIYVTRNSHS